MCKFRVCMLAQSVHSRFLLFIAALAARARRISKHALPQFAHALSVPYLQQAAVIGITNWQACVGHTAGYHVAVRPEVHVYPWHHAEMLAVFEQCVGHSLLHDS